MARGSRRFGTYLKTLRSTRRMTLEEVERATDADPEPVTRSVLSRLENGMASVSAQKLLALARVYRVRLGLLAERLELDLELESIEHEGVDRWPVADLLSRAAAAGRAGNVRRALLLYELAEQRTLGDDRQRDVRIRALFGVSRSLAAAGRPRSARDVIEDLLGEALPDTDRAWAFFYLAQTSLRLGHPLMARAAYLSLLEVPRPWPVEVEAAAPSIEGEHLLSEGRLEPALDAFLKALDAARAGADPAVETQCLFRLAEIERRRRRFDAAMHWVQRARETARVHGLAPQLVQADTEDGRILAARRRHAPARDALGRARQLARKLDLPAELFAVYLEFWRLARCEKDREEERSALHNLRRLSYSLEQLPPGAEDVAPHL